MSKVWEEFVCKDYEVEDILSYSPNPIAGFYRPVIGEDISDEELSISLKKETIAAIYGYDVDEDKRGWAQWEIAGKLVNGLYFYFGCWCDNTGFECQSEFDIYLTRTYKSLLEKVVPMDRVTSLPW